MKRPKSTKKRHTKARKIIVRNAETKETAESFEEETPILNREVRTFASLP